MFSQKHILVCLGFCLSAASPAFAIENPVDTLPKADTPPVAPDTPVTVEKERTVSPQVQKVLSTVIHPESFGIQGAQAIPFEEVAAFFAPYANKDITIGELIVLSRKVTDLYQRRGYPLSFCYIPVQNFNAKVIKVIVIEGWVSGVTIEGNAGKTEQKIHDIADHLLTEKPLTQKTLERYTNMLSLLPGLKISASLPLPKKADGSTELALKVARKPIDVTGVVESIDPYLRGVVTAKASGNTSLAEEITLSTLISRENEEFYAASYTQPIGSEGLMLRVDASTYDGNPETTNLGSGLDRNVKSLRLSTTLSYPLLLKKNQSLIGSVTFSGTNFEDEIRSEATGRSITTNSDVRTVSIGGVYAANTDTRGRRLQLTLTKGLDSFGASKEITTNFTDARFLNPIDLNFTKFVGNFVQKNVFKKGWGTSISAMAQYSDNNLPITERVIFGGFQYGRAFAPGRIVGDSGWGIALELNRTLPFVYDLPFYKVRGLQPYFLLESAKIYDNSNITPLEDELSSAAIGIRLISADASRSTLDFSIAKALSGSDGDDFLDDLGISINFGIPFSY